MAELTVFELAFLGLVLFDSKDKKLVMGYLEEHPELVDLHQDMVPYEGKGYEISLHHGWDGDEPTAWLLIDPAPKAAPFISFLSPDNAVTGHSYTKDRAWDKLHLHANFGPWDLLRPVGEELDGGDSNFLQAKMESDDGSDV